MPDPVPPGQPPPPPPPRPSFLRRTLALALWIYLALLLATWLLVRQAADRWWPATVIAFGPRWVFALPLILFVPVVLLFHRRAFAHLAAAAFVALVPLAGFCLPWRTLTSSADGPALRVLTCNVDGRALKADALARLIAATRPDVVACQEWTSAHESTLFRDGQWFTLRDDELFLASRYPIRRGENVGARWYAFAPGAAVRYEVDTPAGTIDFYNLHLMSPHVAFAAVLHRNPRAPAAVERNTDDRRRQLEDLRDAIARRPGRPALMVGDFNTPDDTPLLRRNLPAFQNAFTTAGLGFGPTYHARWTQARIDHVLASPDWHVRRCQVGPDVGSAHRPVIADLQLAPKSEQRR